MKGGALWRWLIGSRLAASNADDDGLRRLPPSVIGKNRALETMNRAARQRVAQAEDGLVSLEVERSLVLDGTDRIVRQIDGDQSRVPLTDEDLRAMRGRVVTHNHPLGRTFSAADVRAAHIAGMRELRAVAGAQVYSLTAGEGERFRAGGLPNVERAWTRHSKGWERAPNPSAAAHVAWQAVARECKLNYALFDRESAS